MSASPGLQVDLVAATSSSFVGTVGMLGRLAQAGVDIYTLESAVLFGDASHLPNTYIGIIETQMLNTRKYGISADLLYIGTGISVIPRQLARSRGGVAFSAVAVALISAFSSNYTARVLQQTLEKLCPDRMIPATSQLEALSNELTASIKDPEFGNLVWGIERLMEVLHGTPMTPLERPDPPMANEMSAVVFSLMTLGVGGHAVIRSSNASLSWVAVFAYRVLGLSVIFQAGSRIVCQWTPPKCDQDTPRGSVRVVYRGSAVSGDRCYEVLKPANVECSLNLPEIDEFTNVRISVRKCTQYVFNWFFAGTKSGRLIERYIGNLALLFLQSGIALRESEDSPVAPQPLPFEANDALRALREMFGPKFEFWEYEGEASLIERENLMFFPDAFAQIESKPIRGRAGTIGGLKCLMTLWTISLFIEAVGEVGFKTEALKLLIRSPDRVFGSAWREPGPGGYILYKNLSRLVFSFVGGVSIDIQPPPNKRLAPVVTFSEHFPSAMDPVACASDGFYLAIGTLLDIDQSLRQVVRFSAGRGGLFINGKAVPMLHTFRNEHNTSIHPNMFRADIVKSTYPSNLVPTTDETRLSLSSALYVREGRHGTTQVAWHISARRGIDMAVEVYIDPIELVGCELAAIQPGNGDNLVGPSEKFEVQAINVEAYLSRHNWEKPIKSVVLCHGNTPARILTLWVALWVRRDRWTIKQSSGVSLECCLEVLKKGDADLLILA
ncbi:hypothetical protein K440DRAFT_614236 [Wilcoxina mikolae CBS 423.85]|nr:hypothetical protein K440DRAFT_614236 [Wilcoxina mikolae CBS 423.85]